MDQDDRDPAPAPLPQAPRRAYSRSMMTVATPLLPPADWRDFLALTKPRVMTLVVFTGLCGMLAAPVGIHPVLGFAAILCIALGAGAAGALNQWYEADIDAKMRRTQKRPLPDGRMERESALHFGVGLAAFSVILMYFAVNFAAAAILTVSILFYVLIYTVWLKRRTPQNIVIGGAAGAFPPVIGWAAVTGSLSVEALVMFAIIFVWTPPHFWALSLYASGDYQRAGVPMLPVVAGARATRRQIWLYSLLLVPVSLLPVAIGMAGPAYAAAAAVLGAYFLYVMWRVKQDSQDAEGRSLSNDAPARAGFRYSILYLFALFTALAADVLVFGA